MGLLLCVLFVLCSHSSSYGGVEHNRFLWSQISKEFEESKWRMRGQLQHRYSFDQKKLYEEQINIRVSRATSFGTHGFIYTIGTQDGYARKGETRYAMESSWLLRSLNFVQHQWRFRIEARDFSQYDVMAFRFRWRNQFSFTTWKWQGGQPRLSSEFNFYLNDFGGGSSGFSSHRTILGLNFTWQQAEFFLAYLNDYRDEERVIEIRHVLLLGLHF